MVSIVLAIGAPSFSVMARSNRLATENNQITSLLAAARSAAVTRGARVYACPRNAAGTGCAADWSAGLLAFADDNGDGALGAGEGVLHVSPPLGGGNTLSAAVQAVGFGPSGALLDGNPVTLTLCDPQTRKASVVSIGPVGRVSTSRGGC